MRAGRLNNRFKVMAPVLEENTAGEILPSFKPVGYVYGELKYLKSSESTDKTQVNSWDSVQINTRANTLITKTCKLIIQDGTENEFTINGIIKSKEMYQIFCTIVE